MELVHQTLTLNGSGTMFDVYERLFPARAVAAHTINTG